MTTYQFDFTVITDGDTEGDAMEEAMQLLADYRFAKEAATVTNLDFNDRTLRCPSSPGEIVGCGGLFIWTASEQTDFDGMVDCPHCGVCFDPNDPNNKAEIPIAP